MDARLVYSRERLQELQTKLEALSELRDFPGLTIFGAGSYARLEASEYSDIDLFLMSTHGRTEVPELRTKSLRALGRVIDVVYGLNFPEFSNDCEYLVVLHSDDILRHLGSRADDHENYFTARMLLLLESKCLFGQGVYDAVIRQIIESYFRDYPDHAGTFKPVFLLNDICRFWKTMLLNYENKRTPKTNEDPTETNRRRTKQKVRNFKLKYSRMTTCFASIAALGSHTAPVTEEQVFELTALTPRQRLESVPARVSGTDDLIADLLGRYSWFLEMTALSTEDLEARITEKESGEEMFRNATAYGDAMFKLLMKIDEAAPDLRLIRTLVI